MSRKKEFLLRVYVVFGLFSLVALVMIGKAFYISQVEGDYWRAKAKEQLFVLMPFEAERGKILADDGSPMAISLPFFELRFDTQAPGMKDKNRDLFKESIDSLSLVLSQSLIPDRSPSEIKTWLVRERKAKNQYVLIARNVDYNTLELVKKFPLFRYGQNKGGLRTIRHNRREKPFKILANRTIGLFRDSLSIGLENSFNEILKGEEGERLMKKIGDHQYLPVDEVSEIEAKKGKDIVTTLNIGIQEVAQEALAEAMLTHNADKACAVVMDVKTGAICAIANLGRSESGELVENYNYAVGYSSEPGSTLKTASTLAMLEEGAVNLKTPVSLGNGITYFYNKEMKDSHTPNISAADLYYAFIESSNVGISKLAWSSFGNSPSKFAAYYEKFGLTQKTGIEIGGEPFPVIKNPIKNKKTWYGTTIPWMSVGYEVQLTPLQILTFYNAIANNGRMMKPFLVKTILDNDEEVKRFSPTVMKDSIFSESALNQIHELLKGVVQEGTATLLKNDYYSVAGKTGTAVTNYFVKDDLHKDYQASFCGYFPAENPKYSCIVVVYNPTQGGYYGGQAAAPVFKKIADHCMRTHMEPVAAINQQPRPLLASELLPVGNYGHRSDFKEIFQHIGVPFKQETKGEWIRTIADHSGVFTVPVQNIKNLIPDVRGMGLRDAMFLLDDYGIKAIPVGRGKIVRQSKDPGSIISNENLILYLE